MKKRNTENYKVKITWIDNTVTYANANAGGIASLIADPCIESVERI